MEVAQSIIRCIIFYLIIRSVTYLLSSKSTTKVEEQAKTTRKINYIVNGREIDVPHWVYYQRLIGLYGRTDIENTKIEAGAKQTKQELILNYPFLTFEEERDIRAARSYLLDNWGHMVMLN